MTVSRKEDDKMNVLMINGSPNTKGCTFTALTEIGKTLQEQNINYEIMQLGKQPIRDCINCNRCHGDGCIFDDDMVNEFIQKAKNAGMNEHLAKPFEMEKVLRAISRYHKV